MQTTLRLPEPKDYARCRPSAELPAQYTTVPIASFDLDTQIRPANGSGSYAEPISSRSESVSLRRFLPNTSVVANSPYHSSNLPRSRMRSVVDDGQLRSGQLRVALRRRKPLVAQ